ncbi:hypothetical protein VDG44_09915 [Xanthomonas campestris pv. raphani]|uniref:hypothetical protein n=1 Tax=Xanthomonas campestris TaxID=339 RepID=UPI002B222CC0|nr:hypothetical protein [Xanthomonas campestris]MEA9904870.1 hypothetical protein [Xanthomonas campestris pv. raphani]
MEETLAQAVKIVTNDLYSQSSPSEILRLIDSEPNGLATRLGRACLAKVDDIGRSNAFLSAAKSQPYIFFKEAFDLSSLPDTPIDFSPIPECEMTVKARLSTLAIHGLLGFETISYRSENKGNLFVNLVARSGAGALAKKSRGPMRGHTDAASFPFPKMLDSQFPKISPSPDIVTLIGLRNKDLKKTHIIDVIEALKNLDPKEIAILRGPNFFIECQGTFKDGTKLILSQEHIALSAELVSGSENDISIRFSHSKVAANPQIDGAVDALKKFTGALTAKHSIAIEPGSILIVNNRKCLHGRQSPGDAYGGDSRWIMRTYGLKLEFIRENDRYPGNDFQIYP